MKVDTLDELKSAFAEWRKNKKYAREPMPEELLVRAWRAAEKHGEKSVVGVTRVERSRLFRSRPTLKKVQVATKPKQQEAAFPTFSRLEMSALSVPGSRSLPVAEMETGTGVTVRMFEQTPEMLGLFTAACGLGGVR